MIRNTFKCNSPSPPPEVPEYLWSTFTTCETISIWILRLLCPYLCIFYFVYPQGNPYNFRSIFTVTAVQYSVSVPSLKKRENTTIVLIPEYSVQIPDTIFIDKRSGGKKKTKDEFGGGRRQEVVCWWAQRGNHWCHLQGSLCQLLPCCQCRG